MRLCVSILNGILCKARFKTRRSRIGRRPPPFLGTMKLGPHLGWRDRLVCILCQEDSNILAQGRGVPDCHRCLENAIELERSACELNRVAESNCAREPARQAGQREPCLQSLCKRLQRHNQRTCGGPAAEQKQNETEDSPPGPRPGEGAALFSPSPEKEQTPTSPGCPRQGRFVDFLDDLGPGWDAGCAALLREARRTGLCVDSAWGRASLEDAGGCPRRRAD